MTATDKTTGKRVKRMLLAYAVEYEDGSVGFRRILECDQIKDDWQGDIAYGTWGDEHYAYHRSPGRTTITGTGTIVHHWPGSEATVEVEDPPALPAAPLLIEESP